MAYLQFFPPEFIELNKEMCEHPVLLNRLSKHHDTDAELQFSKCIAEICSYCNIALDDTYSETDLIKIADLCIWRLKAKRVAVINTGSSVVVDSPILGLDGKPIIIH